MKVQLDGTDLANKTYFDWILTILHVTPDLAIFLLHREKHMRKVMEPG